MENKKLPEVLSPAGNFEVLRAAVYAGADAIYIGGTQFNARMNAKTLIERQLRKR
jgi:putative protease